MNVEYSLEERNRIANDMFGGADFEIRAYSDTAIAADGTGGTEITADGYSPIEITNDTTTFPAATTGTRANAVIFSKSFDEAATIASIGIFTQTGDFLARLVLDTPLEIEAGQLWRFPVGSFSFTPQNIS